MINKAIEKRNEQKDWDIWLSIYPDMDKDTYIPFEKFRSKAVKVSRVTESTEEIIARAEELRKIHQGIHEGVKKNNGTV